MTRLVVSSSLTFQQPPAQGAALDANTLDLLKLLARFRGVSAAAMLTRLVRAEILRSAGLPKRRDNGARLSGTRPKIVVLDEHDFPSCAARDPPE